MSHRQVHEYKKTAVAVVQKPWCLVRVGAYLEKWVADNQAGTYGFPPTIGLLTDAVCSEPTWGHDMAVEWRDYAPVAPVRIEVGPARKRAYIEPQPAPALLEPADDAEEPVDAGALVLPEPADEDDLAGFLEFGGGNAVAPAPAPAAPRATAVVAVAPVPKAPVLRRPAAAPAPTARGMQLGCSRCRWSKHGCSKCRKVEWRQRRADREALGRQQGKTVIG